MYSLPLQTPPNAFSDSAGIMRCPNRRALTVQVYNQGVYYQLAVASVGVASYVGGEVWTPNDGAFLSPGLWNFDQSDFNGGLCHAIRFKVAITGLTNPATVTATA